MTINDQSRNLTDLARGAFAIQKVADLMASNLIVPLTKAAQQDKRLKLLKELAEIDVDPEVFDRLLDNQLDRRLKYRFAVSFLVLAVSFAAISYAIVIANTLCNLGISEGVLIALLVQTPIQLIGLLYIIARNLFPSSALIPIANS